MQKITNLYDVLIVGAGPAGSNAAISYKKLNPELKVGLIDKSIFPRDKSCGDAIGPGVISALKRFNNEHILENEPQVVSTTLYGPDNIGIQNYIPKVKNKDDENDIKTFNEFIKFINIFIPHIIINSNEVI